MKGKEKMKRKSWGVLWETLLEAWYKNEVATKFQEPEARRPVSNFGIIKTNNRLTHLFPYYSPKYLRRRSVLRWCMSG